MSKRMVAIAIIFVIFLSIIPVFVQNNAVGLTAEPTALKIYIAPTSVLADNNAYNCIFIQLQDGNGRPARATEDTTITLTSQTISVGTVTPSITVPKNETYSSANFTSTLLPGATLITASASGYKPVQATITTVTPIPSSAAIFGFPSTLPADNGIYPALMVQLQDASGRPKMAPIGGVNVRLSCSELDVGHISPDILTIPSGSTYAIANFTTTSIAGKADITTQAQGYDSKTITITTTPVTNSPKSLVIFVGPPRILADSNSYPQIAIELQDEKGYVSSATSDITVYLTSTELGIGEITPSIVIGPHTKFSTYGVANFTSTFKAGTTTLVATATDMNHDEHLITTVEYIPPKLGVYVCPPIEPADALAYPAVQVQLQDSSGRPAKNLEGDVIVYLFSEKPEVASINQTLMIPTGKTQATAFIAVTNSPGSTAITATASGYSTGKAQISTYLIDYTRLQVELSANPQSINNSKVANLKAYITGDGAPTTGATVKFASDNGGTFATVREQGGGYYTVDFTAPNFVQTATCTITATASKTNYLDGQNTVAITVVPSSTSTSTSTPTSNPTATPRPSPTPKPGAIITANCSSSLQLCVKDANGNPLNDTIVQSVKQPAGAKQLSAVTNSTGYVTFQNVTAGSYTFQLLKLGYAPMNATLTIKDQPVALPLTLLNGGDQPNTDSSLVLIAVIIVVAVISMSLSILFVIRRKNTAKVRRLKELQKQLNQK